MYLTRLLSSNRNRLTLLAAAFVFVLVQTITLQHSHDGDLSIHVDCQICLKLGSQDDVTVLQSAASEADLLTSIPKVFVPNPNALVAPRPRSRAPPQAI